MTLGETKDWRAPQPISATYTWRWASPRCPHELERALELARAAEERRRILRSPSADLGDVSARLGDFGQAEKGYLRAIELWRTAGNKRGVRQSATYGLADLFEAQGRYGATLDARAESDQNLTRLKDRTGLDRWNIQRIRLRAGIDGARSLKRGKRSTRARAARS